MTAWRKIIGYDYYVAASTPRGGGSVQLELECGHSVHRKRSEQPKGDRVRCKQCEDKLLDELVAEERP